MTNISFEFELKVPSVAHLNNGLYATTMLSIETIVDITSYIST